MHNRDYYFPVSSPDNGSLFYPWLEMVLTLGMIRRTKDGGEVNLCVLNKKKNLSRPLKKHVYFRSSPWTMSEVSERAHT